MANVFQRLWGAVRPPAVSPYKEQGTGGTPIFGGYVVTRERSAAWQGLQRYRTMQDIMTNVSVVAAGVHYFLNVTSRPSWSVVPVSDSDPEAVRMAEFVEEVLHDMETSWERAVRRSIMYRFHGFHIQEWTAKKRDDGLVGFRNLESRPVYTIDSWAVEDNGYISGVWQRSPQTGDLLGLPRSKLFYLVDDEFTDSPEGMGLLRHMAEPYNRLKQFLDLETRAFERDLRGTPIGRAPLQKIREAVKAGAISEEDGATLIQGMKDFVQTQVKSESTGMVLDSAPYLSQAADGAKVASLQQWGMELLTGPANGLVELGAAIERVQIEMARIGGWESLMMGAGSSGNRSLSEDKSRNLYLTANSVLSHISSVANKDVIDPLWTLNGFDDDLKPHLQPEDVTFKDVSEITAALRDMATAGAILTPDDPAVDDVRDLMGVSRSNKDAMVEQAMDRDEPTDEEVNAMEEELDKLMRNLK